FPIPSATVRGRRVRRVRREGRGSEFETDRGCRETRVSRRRANSHRVRGKTAHACCSTPLLARDRSHSKPPRRNEKADLTGRPNCHPCRHKVAAAESTPPSVASRTAERLQATYREAMP